MRIERGTEGDGGSAHEMDEMDGQDEDGGEPENLESQLQIDISQPEGMCTCTMHPSYCITELTWRYQRYVRFVENHL